MSFPLQFRTALEARWAALGYTATPLLYGFREVARTKDIEAVTLGHGRIVYHAGSWPGPDANAGTMSHVHGHVHRSGRDYGSDAVLFTAHIHGHNPAFPDPTASGAECAHDDICWALKEMFFAAVKHVQIANKWHSVQYGSEVWVRDPEQRRLGELLRVEFLINVGLRSAPEYPFQQFEQKPVGAAVGQSGNETIVVEVP